jgi:hypothetical protein
VNDPHDNAQADRGALEREWWSRVEALSDLGRPLAEHERDYLDVLRSMHLAPERAAGLLRLAVKGPTP